MHFCNRVRQLPKVEVDPDLLLWVILPAPAVPAVPTAPIDLTVAHLKRLSIKMSEGGLQFHIFCCNMDTYAYSRKYVFASLQG
jgi:hypothetical protein